MVTARTAPSLAPPGTGWEAAVELPEVEVVRRDLEKDVVGRRIREAEVRPQRGAMRVIRRHARRKEFADRLAGRKITKVDRKGKYVLLYLDDGNVLVVHFGMSGQLLRGTKRQAMTAHTHVVIEFTQGGDLRYVDPRTFGEMFVTGADALGKVKELDHVAIDPLEDTFTWQQFSAELARRAAKLKALLMDQKFVSGLGNIYSDEVLFAAGLRFDHMSDNLSSQEVRRLYRAIREIVQDAIRFRGTTLDDEAYVDLFGKPGEFQAELKVYGRRGEPCRRCRTPIVTERFAGRTTYFCPQCQS
jgi:formamidopyrimidine-DNA glycosylase